MTRCSRWRRFLGFPIIEFWKSVAIIRIFPVLQGIFLELVQNWENRYTSFMDCTIESRKELLTLDLDLRVPLCTSNCGHGYMEAGSIVT